MPKVSATKNHAYVRFDHVSGVRQRGSGLDVSPMLAMDARNVDAKHGMIQTAARPLQLEATLAEPIGTLAYLYRRWTDDPIQEIFIAASGGKLYWAHPDDAQFTECAGVTGFQSDKWSVAAYEINPVGSLASVDVLILSNASDGMHMVRGDTFEVSVVPAPKKPGVISRYAERIFGAGIADDPDMLMYCAPFDPTNWNINPTYPEDGAGDIMQPSWDGDEFTALAAFGSQLLAFKKRRIWRVLGVNPGEFAMKEQYGGGAEFPGTIAAVGTDVMMIGRESLLRYDGMDVARFGEEYASELFKSMNILAARHACGVLHEGIYYVAIPVNGSAVNNVVLSYDTKAATWMIWEDLPVASWLSTDDALYFTSAVEPGRIFKWRGGVEALPMRWTTGWFEFDRIDTVKENFEVMVSVESANTQHINILLETDRMSQDKELCIEKTFNGRPGPPLYTLPFGVRGRRWRVTLSAPTGYMWKVHSLTVSMDINED